MTYDGGVLYDRAMPMISVRLDDELAAWVTATAEERGVTKTVLVEQAIRVYRDNPGVQKPHRAPPRTASQRRSPGHLSTCRCPVCKSMRGKA